MKIIHLYLKVYEDSEIRAPPLFERMYTVIVLIYIILNKAAWLNERLLNIDLF